MSADRALEPLPPERWPDRIGHLANDFAGDLNVYRLMAHDPELLAAWSPLREHVVTKNALGAERLEIVVLRTAARLGVGYEWAHHVDRAAKLGMDQERVRAMAGPREAMSGQDSLLAGIVDDLLDTTRIAPERSAALIAMAGKTAVLDLIATVGFYVTLGAILNTFDVPLEERIAPVDIPT